MPGIFGNAQQAVPSIVEIKNHLDRRPGGALLAGLEHLDERYLRAVGYSTKSKRGSLPKMVLIGDIVGDDDHAVARAASDVIRLANGHAGEGFVAVSLRPARHSGQSGPERPQLRGIPMPSRSMRTW